MNSLGVSVIVSAARSGKPVVNKVVLNCRFRDQPLVAETDEAVFVCGNARDKVTRWHVKATTLRRDSVRFELCDHVRR